MNNKGSFKEDGSVGSKLKTFFKESGFYIAIVVGLCALAAGAVFFSTNQILTDPDQNQAQDNGPDDNDNLGLIDYENPLADVEDQGSLVDNDSLNADEGPYTGIDGQASEGEQAQSDVATNDSQASTGDKETKPASGNKDASANDDSATQDVVLAVVRPAFKAPVEGKIQTEYSMDKLVFSATFSDWRTHSGVDIAAARGEVVRSVGNGVVSEIKNDPRYGFIVVIDHKNGYKSLYANLANDPTMTAGKEIKLGDPIGSIGATAIFESAEPTHLHFELFKENKLVDPAAYIDIAK